MLIPPNRLFFLKYELFKKLNKDYCYTFRYDKEKPNELSDFISTSLVKRFISNAQFVPNLLKFIENSLGLIKFLHD